MQAQGLAGLIAATHAPHCDDSRVNLGSVRPMVEHLPRSGINGVYVGGSPDEGISNGKWDGSSQTR